LSAWRLSSGRVVLAPFARLARADHAALDADGEYVVRFLSYAATDVLERRLISAYPAIAYELERGEQRVVDAAEVVQEQRLVEAPRPGSLACAGAGESSRLQRLERRLSDPRLRSGEVLLDVTPGANVFHVGSILSTRSKQLLIAFTRRALSSAAGNLDRQLG
jgi:hypothetical protein